MADILLKRDSELAATYVPNTFIDEYMTHASGEFVKIYLYLLRCMGDADVSFSISDMADKFDHTEKDVKRALRYWEKMHLLRLEFDDQDELVGICLLNSNASTMRLEKTQAASPRDEKVVIHKEQPSDTPAPSAVPARTEYTLDELQQFSKDETVQELLFVAEQYLRHPLNNLEVQTILYWLDKLHFSQDLIEYLIDYCLEKGHASIRYMDKVALAWAEQNIHSPAQAKQESGMHKSAVHTVIRAFGISGRNLVDFERAYIDKWSNSMGFSDEIIACACERTIRSTHQSSFEYADSILNNWKKQHVCSQKDIELLDAQYQEAQAGRPSGGNAASPRTAKGTAANGFSNFRQRSYDYEELEKELLTR